MRRTKRKFPKKSKKLKKEFPHPALPEPSSEPSPSDSSGASTPIAPFYPFITPPMSPAEDSSDTGSALEFSRSISLVSKRGSESDFELELELEFDGGPAASTVTSTPPSETILSIFSSQASIRTDYCAFVLWRIVDGRIHFMSAMTVEAENEEKPGTLDALMKMVTRREIELDKVNMTEGEPQFICDSTQPEISQLTLSADDEELYKIMRHLSRNEPYSFSVNLTTKLPKETDSFGALIKKVLLSCLRRFTLCVVITHEEKGLVNTLNFVHILECRVVPSILNGTQAADRMHADARESFPAATRKERLSRMPKLGAGEYFWLLPTSAKNNVSLSKVLFKLWLKQPPHQPFTLNIKELRQPRDYFEQKSITVIKPPRCRLFCCAAKTEAEHKAKAETPYELLTYWALQEFRYTAMEDLRIKNSQIFYFQISYHRLKVVGSHLDRVVILSVSITREKPDVGANIPNFCYVKIKNPLLNSLLSSFDSSDEMAVPERLWQDYNKGRLDNNHQVPIREILKYSGFIAQLTDGLNHSLYTVLEGEEEGDDESKTPEP